MARTIPPTPKPQRPTADDTRDRILEAALELFSERSFEGATTRQISERAGVTQPLLNYHFHGKDELSRAAVAGVFDRLTAAISTRVEGLRGVDDLTVTKLVVREFVLSGREPTTAPDHHPGVQSRRSPHRLARRHLHPTALRHDRRTVRTADRRRARSTRPRREPLLHPHGGGRHDVRARTRVPSTQRYRPSDPTVIEQHADAVVALLFGAQQPSVTTD